MGNYLLVQTVTEKEIAAGQGTYFIASGPDRLLARIPGIA